MIALKFRFGTAQIEPCAPVTRPDPEEDTDRPFRAWPGDAVSSQGTSGLYKKTTNRWAVGPPAASARGTPLLCRTEKGLGTLISRTRGSAGGRLLFLTLLLGLVTGFAGCDRSSNTGTRDDDIINPNEGDDDAPPPPQILVEIDVNPQLVTLAEGQIIVLQAIGVYEDGTTEDITDEALWHSTDESVATVAGGLVVALDEGQAGISCELQVTSNEVVLEVVAATEGEVAIRMNAAGDEVQADGDTFLADGDFDGSSPGFTGGSTYSNPIPVAGTSAVGLYQDLRWGSIGFKAPVPNGQYVVELHFAEIYPDFGSGSRVFDVLLEEQVVESELDVAEIAGFATALVRTHFVMVVDGVLDVDFQSGVNYPMLSAVEIRSIGEIPDLEVTALSVSPTSAIIFEEGLKAFTALAEYNFGLSQNVTGQAAWQSSDPSILAPTATPGLMEALAIGEAVVSVSFGGFTAQATVAVQEAPLVGEALIFTRANHLNLFDVIPRDRDYIEDDAHGDIMKLEPVSPSGTLTNLTNLPTGNGAVAFTPSVTPDGQFILFSMRSHFLEMYQIYRMRVDGSELTQLTFPPASGAPHDNIYPTVIGGNRIAFLSNRDFMYDEYGKRNQYNLYTMNTDGSDPVCHLDGLSGNYDLNCFSDGSIVFTRWDYRPLMNKVTIDNYSLWRMNTDGSDMRPLWGLHYLTPRPGNHGIQDWRRAHELPDGRMVVIGMGRIYTAHDYGSGFVAIVDPVTTLLDPYTNITPGVPEDTDPSPVGRYLEAVPWGDKLVVVHSTGPVAYGIEEPNWNLAVMNTDGSGQYSLVDDSGYHLAQPRLVQPRPAPPFVSTVTEDGVDYGILSADNVFIENIGEEIGSLNRPPHDASNPQLNPVKVRLLEGYILKKTQFYGGTPRDTTFISDVKASLAYRVLGEVPIKSDGSFAAQVPANRPIVIQTLNAQNQTIVSMPFWTMVAPGETKRCVGCHDPHDNSVSLAPTNQALEEPIFDATGGEILDYQDDVSPILASKCGSCHSGADPAFGIDLSGDRTLFRDIGYRYLSETEYGRFGLPSWMPFSYLASKDRGLGGVDSFLLCLVSGDLVYGGTSSMNARVQELHPTHANLLTQAEQNVLSRWTGMATLFGTPCYRYIPEGQADEHFYPQPDMAMWQNEVAPMLVSRCSGCHTQYPSALPIPGFTVNTSHNARSANVNQQSVSALLNRTGVNSNFDHPEWSPILKLGLGDDDHPTIFSSANDPDYQLLLEWIETADMSSG